MDFVVRVYEVTAKFPKEEKYGLIAQLRTSAVSVPSNIAEGAGRGTNKQFKRFLEISMGSANEVQTQIEVAARVGYIARETADNLIEEALQIYKMTLAFYNTLSDEG